VSDKCNYVNFDSLTIKELSCFIVNGILFQGVGRICPIYAYESTIFDESEGIIS